MLYNEKNAGQERVFSVSSEDSARVDLYAVIGLGSVLAAATCLIFGAIDSLDQSALHSMVFYSFLAIAYYSARFPAVGKIVARKHSCEAAFAASFLPLTLLVLRFVCPADSATVFSLSICALSGFLGGFYMLSHFRLLECGRRNTSPRTVLVSYVFSFAICALVLVLEEQADMVFFCALPVLSAGSLVLQLRRGRFQNWNESFLRDVPAVLSAKTHVILFAYMCVFGFCLSAASTSLNMAVTIALIAMSLVVTAWFERVNRRFLRTLGESAVVFLPLCVFCLFAICSSDPLWMRVSLIASSVILVYQGVRNQTFLVRLSGFLGTSLAADIAQGRFPPLAGTATGLALGFVHVQLAGSGEQVVTLALPTMLAVVVVTVYTLMPFNRGTPIKDGLVFDPEEDVVPWKPGDVHELDTFDHLCQQITSGCNLTPREKEVFRLLACGYNAESIADILVVSSSTVKTHVARIYRKLEVHSQQEIISMIHKER